MTTRTAGTSEGANANHQAEGPEVARHGGLVTVRCTLTGRTPLLMNAMSEEQLLRLRSKEKAAKNAAKPSLRDEAAGKVYTATDGTPIIPGKNLFATFRDAGAYVRLDGKRQISTSKETRLPGMMTLLDHALPVYVPGKPEHAHWEIDIQQGRNPNGGEAVCIVRPRFDAWELRCDLEIDLAEMPLQMAYDLVSIAGRRIGLCDFRPQCKGTFGCYVISRWDDKEE